MPNNLYYEGNTNVKADGVVEKFTPEMLAEYKKCMESPQYFCRNYMKVISLDDGLVPFDLYPYQEKMFDNIQNNRFNIILACRQSGKTIACVGYILWYALFHSEKNIAILANKGATARSILSKLKLAFENVPFFLQPGTKAFNMGSVKFSNNTNIVAASTSNSSIRGESINFLYLDEFAFVERDAEFYTSTYPVITAGKTTQVLITSTANGIGNTFHKIWTGALQRTNSYVPSRVDWWDVPGRDSDWKAETINNTSQLQFDQEYGNTFFGTGDTLIGAEALMSLRAENPKEILEGGSLMIYEEVKPDHQYVMTVDVSEGLGHDYSAFSIINLTTRPFKQVAVYRNNNISPLLFPNIIEKYAKLYNMAFVIVESNNQGSLVCHGLYHDLEYEEIYSRNTVKSDALGQDMNRRTKKIGCSGFKDLLEMKRLEVVDETTISEISTFEAKGQSYEASSGNNDDVVMTLVMLGYFVTTNEFVNRTDVNIRNMLYKQKMQEIEADVPPFGIIDDGVDDIPLEPPNTDDPWQIGVGEELYIEDW